VHKLLRLAGRAEGRRGDEGCLRDFLERANEDGGTTMEYRERGVFNASEMVVEIQSVEAMRNKDLFMVGRSPACILPCYSWSPPWSLRS
jgi:hypothetical protein